MEWEVNMENKTNKNIELTHVIITAEGIVQPSFFDDPYFYKDEHGKYIIPDYPLLPMKTDKKN